MKRKYDIYDIESHSDYMEDEIVEIRNPEKILCEESYWKKNTNEKNNFNINFNKCVDCKNDLYLHKINYVCVLHDNDIHICSIYECSGIKKGFICNKNNYIL